MSLKITREESKETVVFATKGENMGKEKEEDSKQNV
jgi:hypothetical protein